MESTKPKFNIGQIVVMKSLSNGMMVGTTDGIGIILYQRE